MDRPTIGLDETGAIPGKPFVLAVPTDHEDFVTYMTAGDLAALISDISATTTAHAQATCAGHVLDIRHAEQLDEDRRAGKCVWCGLEIVTEFDGTVVPVDTGDGP